MAGNKGTEARYGIRFDSNAKEVGESGATALEQLKEKIDGNRAAIRSYGDALRALKGNTDELKRARAELKNKLDAERTALSQNTAAVLKAGSSYDQLAAKQRKVSDELKRNREGVAKSISAAGGPAASLKTKLGELSEALSTSEGRAALFAKGMTVMAAATAVAVVGVIGGIAALTAKFAEWILVSGNALRTQRLTREAFVGNEEDARRLGNQIEALGTKVPQSRAELNELGNDLVRAGIRGQTLVDTLNATAQASAALGSSAANQIRSFVERGRLTGRFALGQLETQGTGIQFSDVAAALAKNTKTSIAEASTALIQGQVTLGDGAKALRDAVEKRFGGVNLAKMLDLDVLKTKAADFAQALTKDINVEPLLRDVRDLFSVFDTNTQTGSGVKELVTWVGTNLVDAIHTVAPLAKEWFESLVLKGLQLELAWLQLRVAWRDTFGDDALGDLADLRVDFDKLMPSIDAVIGTLRMGAGAVRWIGEVRDDLKVAADNVDHFASRWLALEPTWAGIGQSIVEGIISPMASLPSRMGEISDKAVAAVKESWGIHSPSKVAEDIALNIDRGMVRGHERGDDAVLAARSRSGDEGGSTSGSGAPSQRLELVVHVHLNGDAKREDADSIGQTIGSKLVEVLEQLNRRRGFA